MPIPEVEVLCVLMFVLCSCVCGVHECVWSVFRFFGMVIVCVVSVCVVFICESRSCVVVVYFCLYV